MTSLLGFSFFGTCNGVNGFVSPREFPLPQSLHILVDTKFPFLWDVDVYRCKTIKLEGDKFLNFIGLYTKLDDFRGVREGAFGGVGIFVRDGYVDTQKAVALLKAMQVNLLAASSDNRKFVRTIDEAKDGGYLKAPSGFADLADSFKPGERGMRSAFQLQAQYVISAQDITVSDPIGFLDFAQDEVDGRISDLFFCSSPEVHLEIRKNYLDTLSIASTRDILNTIVSSEKEAFKAAAAADIRRKQAAEKARAAEAQRSLEEQHYKRMDRFRKLESDLKVLEAQVADLTGRRDQLSLEVARLSDSSGIVNPGNSNNAGSVTVLEGVIAGLKLQVADSQDKLNLSESLRAGDKFAAKKNITILGVLCILFFFLSVIFVFLWQSSGKSDADSAAFRKRLDSVTQQLEFERESNKMLQASNDKLISDINNFKRSVDTGAVVPTATPPVPAVTRVSPATTTQVDEKADKKAAEKREKEAAKADKKAAEKKEKEAAEAKKKLEEEARTRQTGATQTDKTEERPKEPSPAPPPVSLE